MTPAQRSELARAAVLTRWARTPNRREATKAATLAYLRKYLPDAYDTLTPAEQETALDCARRAHCAKMRAARAAKQAETAA